MLTFVCQYYNVVLQEGCNAQLHHYVFNYSEYRGSNLVERTIRYENSVY